MEYMKKVRRGRRWIKWRHKEGEMDRGERRRERGERRLWRMDEKMEERRVRLEEMSRTRVGDRTAETGKLPSIN